jgi:hypothetical protein
VRLCILHHVLGICDQLALKVVSTAKKNIPGLVVIVSDAAWWNVATALLLI